MECGKGTCVADLSYPLGFKCQCDQGWSRNDDGYADLAFRPCVIPNCKFFFLQFFKINYLWLYAINLSHKKYSLLLLLFSKSPLLDRTLYNLGEYKSRAPLSLSLIVVVEDWYFLFPRVPFGSIWLDSAKGSVVFICGWLYFQVKELVILFLIFQVTETLALIYSMCLFVCFYRVVLLFGLPEKKITLAPMVRIYLDKAAERCKIYRLEKKVLDFGVWKLVEDFLKSLI